MAADGLADEAGFDDAESASSVGLGQCDTDEPGLGHQRPFGARKPIVTRFDLFESLVVDLVAEDLHGQVADRLFGFVQVEVHRYFLRFSRGRAMPAHPMMSRCSSLVPPPNVKIQTPR
jgi:hypothetical protein